MNRFTCLQPCNSFKRIVSEMIELIYFTAQTSPLKIYIYIYIYSLKPTHLNIVGPFIKKT